MASNVVTVAAGAFHTLFTTTDGTLWAFGQNNNGQTGNGTYNNVWPPINLPQLVVANVFPADEAYHSLAIGHIKASATNLTPPMVWQPVFTNYADTNGNWSFTITGLTNYPTGCYRAVAQ